MSQQINITRIKVVARALQELNQPVVFVGGATVALYADAAAPEARPTDDVDVVIELASCGGYAGLEEKLRAIGFTNDTSSRVICRYKIQGITVDMMPTQPDIIGFSNKWYPEGFAQAIPINLDGQEVKIFSLPYFLATKLEAFKNRGQQDYRTSSDFEDLVYILENNTTIAQTLAATSSELQHYLKIEFARLLADSEFEEGLYAHLEPAHAAATSEEIRYILREFVVDKS
jgi:predicted nucleotidyltransferase